MLTEPPACLPPWTHVAAEKGEAVKQPMEADFDVQVREGHVEVIFRPTESHMSFGILVDPKDIRSARPSLSISDRSTCQDRRYRRLLRKRGGSCGLSAGFRCHQRPLTYQPVINPGSSGTTAP